jgi:hypothetical protein
MLGYLRMDYSSYTGVANPGKGAKSLIGQVHFNLGHQSARVTFLAPDFALENHALVALIEHLAWESGNRGAFRIISELDETGSMFESFRVAGFSVYTRQQIWKLPSQSAAKESGNTNWRPLQNIDQYAVQNLYHAVVPPLVQSAEGLNKRPIQGFGYQQNDEILAFVEIIYGPNGIYLNPVVHPNLRQPEEIIASMLNQIPNLLGRPLYLAIRDYQSWLNDAAISLNGEPSDRRVLMVKHLARQQREAVTSSLRKVLEQHSAEPTSPMMQHSQSNKRG